VPPFHSQSPRPLGEALGLTRSASTFVRWSFLLGWSFLLYGAKYTFMIGRARALSIAKRALDLTAKSARKFSGAKRWLVCHA
jgi:hypothetical protein